MTPEKQRRNREVLVKTALICYLILAVFAASSIWWCIVMVLAGIGVFVAGYTDAISFMRDNTDDK